MDDKLSGKKSWTMIRTSIVWIIPLIRYICVIILQNMKWKKMKDLAQWKYHLFVETNTSRIEYSRFFFLNRIFHAESYNEALEKY